MEKVKNVTLKSEELGEREFHPAHAEKLLAFQERRGVSHWQPVKADKKTKTNTDGNETNGATNSTDTIGSDQRG